MVLCDAAAAARRGRGHRVGCTRYQVQAWARHARVAERPADWQRAATNAERQTIATAVTSLVGWVVARRMFPSRREGAVHEKVFSATRAAIATIADGGTSGNGLRSAFCVLYRCDQTADSHSARHSALLARGFTQI